VDEVVHHGQATNDQQNTDVEGNCRKAHVSSKSCVGCKEGCTLRSALQLALSCNMAHVTCNMQPKLSGALPLCSRCMKQHCVRLGNARVTSIASILAKSPLAWHFVVYTGRTFISMELLALSFNSGRPIFTATHVSHRLLELSPIRSSLKKSEVAVPRAESRGAQSSRAQCHDPVQ